MTQGRRIDMTPGKTCMIFSRYTHISRPSPSELLSTVVLLPSRLVLSQGVSLIVSSWDFSQGTRAFPLSSPDVDVDLRVLMIHVHLTWELPIVYLESAGKAQT